MFGATEKGKYSLFGCRCFYFVFFRAARNVQHMIRRPFVQEFFKIMNTNYDFAADVKLNNCIICVQETVKVFKWQVGVLTAKKKVGKKT